MRESFLGWKINLVKDIPFATIKMLLYEGFARVYCHFGRSYLSEKKNNFQPTVSATQTLTPVEAGFVGLISGAVTGIVTCPLDVINTRVKGAREGAAALRTVQGVDKGSMWGMGVHILKAEGGRALFKGVGLRMTIIGLGSTWFWALFQQFQKWQE
jgi:hypothetical protein